MCHTHYSAKSHTKCIALYASCMCTLSLCRICGKAQGLLIAHNNAAALPTCLPVPIQLTHFFIPFPQRIKVSSQGMHVGKQFVTLQMCCYLPYVHMNSNDGGKCEEVKYLNKSKNPTSMEGSSSYLINLISFQLVKVCCRCLHWCLRTHLCVSFCT